MVTLCLIGCDPSVSVRPVWSELAKFETSFLAQLGRWGNLSELQLSQESAFKIARRDYGGTSFTWIALYRSAGAFKRDRPNTFMGVGILLDGAEVVPGKIAVDFLARTLTTFLAEFAPQGALTCQIDDITPALFPEPEGAEALRAAVYTPPTKSGLMVQIAQGSGGAVFFDLAGPDEAEKIGDYIDRCQSDPLFENYHTLLIGDAPDPSEKRLVKGVVVKTVSAFFDRPERNEAVRELPVLLEPKHVQAGPRAASYRDGGPRLDRPSDNPLDSFFRAKPPQAPRAHRESGLWRSLALVLFGVVITLITLIALGYGPPGTQSPTPDPTSYASDTNNDTAEDSDGGSGTALQDQSMPTERPLDVVNDYFEKLKSGDFRDASELRFPGVPREITSEARAMMRARVTDLLVTVEYGGEPRLVDEMLRAEVPTRISGTLDGAQFSQKKGTIIVVAKTINGEARWLIYDEGRLARYDPLLMVTQ